MHNLNMYIFPIEFLSIDYLPRYWLSNFTISFTNFALKYTVYIYIYSFIAGYFQYCDGTEEQKILRTKVSLEVNFQNWKLD